MCRSAPSSRCVGSVRQMTNSTTAPSGRFTKKIQCQPKLSVINPPMAGPSRKLTPKTAPKKPWYLPRSDGAKMSAMIASAIGKSAPAPRPWTPRKSQELPHLLAQAAEQGADQEDAHADQEDRPAAEDVGELPVHRTGDRRRQQVRREGPDVDVVALELGDDRGQGGADDRLVERGEEDAEQDRTEDLEADAVRQLDRRAVVVVVRRTATVGSAVMLRQGPALYGTKCPVYQ